MKDTGRKWKHSRIVCVAANKRDEANALCVGFGWGKDFFSIPLRNKVDGKIKEYAADVVLTDAMLDQLEKLNQSVLKKEDIVAPVTKAKNDAKLAEVAAKRNVNVGIAAAAVEK